MKIAIYTFTAANNYGAVLQAYALKQFLCSLGAEVHDVDYRPQYLVERYRPFSRYRLFGKGNPLKNTLKEILQYRTLRNKNQLFDQFRNKYLDLILPSEALESDLYIIGSDQVWNYKITKGDLILLGDIDGSKGNVISYAASMEENLSETATKNFSKRLKDFSAISVRELSLQNKLQKDYDINSTLVVDPTLLLSADEWKKVEKPYTKADKPYLLLYGFGFTKQDMTSVEAFSKEKGLRVIRLTTGSKFTGGYRNDVSPEQFIYLFDNAEYVVTNSFHGTSFSLIFNKPFLEIPNHALGLNKRVKSLFDLQGIATVCTDISNGILETNFIQISDYSDNLKDLIDTSKQFLLDQVHKFEKRA